MESVGSRTGSVMFLLVPAKTKAESGCQVRPSSVVGEVEPQSMK